MSVYFSYAQFERPFTRPFRFGETSLHSRRGILIRRTDDHGSICTEASPLPGYSSDRLEEVAQALQYLSTPEIEEMAVRGALNRDLPPALSFALEGVGAQLAAGTRFRRISSNAFLSWAGAEETRRDFLARYQEGYRVFKVKAVEEWIAELPSFLRSLPEGQWKFRFDGNRSLSPAALANFFREMDRTQLLGRVDYFEEPLANWSHALVRESPVALAADETIASAADALRLLESPWSPQVFVLKPTVLGALGSLVPLVRQLERAGRRVVFTTTIESEAGRRALLSFLGAQDCNEVHGLSTGYLLQNNFLPDAPFYDHLPETSPEEMRFRQGLDWRMCP